MAGCDRPAGQRRRGSQFSSCYSQRVGVDQPRHLDGGGPVVTRGGGYPGRGHGWQEPLARAPVAGRASLGAWFVIVPLVAIIATGVWALLVFQHQSYGDWIDLPIFIALFVAAETAVIRLVVRREGVTVTINEIPFVLALFFLPPLTVITVRFVSALTVQLMRRLRPEKIAFNVASTTAATTVATLIYVQLGPIDGVGPYTWIAMYLAVGCNSVVSLLAVAGVIAVVQSL